MAAEGVRLLTEFYCNTIVGLERGQHRIVAQNPNKAPPPALRAAITAHGLVAYFQAAYANLCRGNDPYLERVFGGLGRAFPHRTFCILNLAFHACAAIVGRLDRGRYPETLQALTGEVHAQVWPLARAAAEALAAASPGHVCDGPDIRAMDPSALQFQVGPEGRAAFGVDAERRRQAEAKMARRFCAQCAAPARRRCGGCHQTGYCGRACQKAHWPAHRAACAPAGAAKEPARLGAEPGGSPP